ncbi:unnamed protein product [Adineta steineri]|uniref:G-protein coupled receptors family 1 profile domain-containing protein n=1 Tax=Adineta steineri TaxID=433720 RepID=A0A814WCX5_9BILA|nr:unnamed protein product [Adineta steineri]CAF3848269.1 unnamed protein product [Adineta steineri]
MSNEVNSSLLDISLLPYEIGIPRVVRFWIILIFYIPSLICSLFVLYYFIASRTLRQALHNHVITLLLIVNFIVQLTSIPWIINYYRLEGQVSPQSPSFCIVWILIDEGLTITITALFAWATVERHILIFHDQLVATRRKILIFHYLPIVVVLLYCFFYSLIVIIIPPCENVFDYTQLVCGYPLCYYDQQALAIWDIVFDHLIPIIIIISCSLGLLLRILYQKSHMRQPTRWRNYRKMTIQLLSISFLYLIIYIPHMFMEFLHLCCIPEEVGADFKAYSQFFLYYGNLLLPVVCAGSMPELQSKLKKLFVCCKRQARAVQPETIALSRRAGDRHLKNIATAQ